MYSLTVIIPNYNKANYLQKCVQSILEQTRIPDEIIIIDDCSKDSSKDVIQALCQQNSSIRAVHLEKNSGVSHARNVGLRLAKSNYVTFIDADDFYANRYKLQREMELIEKKGKGIVAYSRLRFADENGVLCQTVKVRKKDYLTGNIYQKMLLGKFQFANIARDYCVQRDILLQLGGYNENRNLYEDLELIIKLAREHEFYCTYEYGTAYRQVPGGLSKQNKEVHKRVRDEIFYEQVSLLSKTRKFFYILDWRVRKAVSPVISFLEKVIWAMKRVVKKVLLYEKK